ncbi:hypothetical protein ACHAWT_009823, partial [Skeletonema menzelii]
QTNADRVFSKPAVAGSSKTNQTNADRVLTKIIKELKIGELAVHEMKSDEVSEFDGKSAPVLPGNTSEESEDDQVARRVDAVVAAAEEIRKKKNAEKSASWSVRRKKERETEATEGRDEEEDAVSSRASKQDEVEKVHSSNKSVKSKKSLKSVRKSQSPEKSLDTPEELKKEDSRSLSTFETSDDTFDMNNGSHTDLEDGDTVDMNTSEEEDTRTLRSMRNGKGKNTIMNKDVIIHVPGGPESLVVRKMYYSPVPKEPEEVIIEVEASTVTVRDCLLCRGIGVDKAKFPFTPGCELVGTITDVGKFAQHEGWRIGDRVVAFDHSKGGGNAKCVKVHMKNIFMISTSIDAAEAACLVDVYMSAYKALQLGRKDGLPLTGKKILVTDGFSPIGQAVVALAKLEGANIYATTSDSNEHEYMSSLGVKCFPFSPSKWLHKVAGLMDIVIDNTCVDSYESSWEAVSSEGMLVCTTGMNSSYNFRRDEFGEGCVGGCADAFGVNVLKYRSKWAAMKAKYLMSNTKFLDLTESITSDPKAYQQQLKYLCFLVESGALVPKIAERIQIEEVPDAHRYLETGKSNGTIVCVPSDKS